MPIATYVETGLLGARTFILHEDRIEFSGKRTFGSIHQQQIPLRTLTSPPARSWVRDLRLESAVGWGALCVLLLFIAYINVRGAELADPEAYARALWIIVGAVLLAIAAYVLFPRRIEFATFVNESGVGVISIGRRGSNASEFDTFVAQVTERVASIRPGV